MKDGQVEDIFANVEDNSQPESLLEDSNTEVADEIASPTVKVEVQKSVKKSSLSLIIMIILGGVALVLIILSGWYFWQNRKEKNSSTVDSSVLQDQGVVNALNLNLLPLNINSSEVNTNADAVLPPSENKFIDEDFDGLSNDTEAKYGTDPKKKDTDNDGLSDREEVRVFATDPLKPDTDNDGFFDGAEVDQGYNPNGPGYLIDYQEEINNKLNNNK